MYLVREGHAAQQDNTTGAVSLLCSDNRSIMRTVCRPGMGHGLNTHSKQTTPVHPPTLYGKAAKLQMPAETNS
jgi:hypothetical protein